MKKSKLFAILLSLLMITATIISTGSDVHATAYTQWGDQLPTGGSSKLPEQTRIKFWGYSTTGSLGNTVVNGTMNNSATTKEYHVTVYIDTNVFHDTTYNVNVAIRNIHGANLIKSTSQTNYSGGSGAYASTSLVKLGSYPASALGTHSMTSNLYGTFKGYTLYIY